MSRDNVTPLFADTGYSNRLPGGPRPPDNGQMEARIAKLEAFADHATVQLGELRADVRDLRREQRSDFKLLFGAIITVALGLAGLIAKSAGWL